MSSQSVPIHRTNTDGTSGSKKKDDSWFNAFDFAPGQDATIRWLSRPNQQAIQGKYSRDTEKFRITFDVENFKPEQIKIYIQNRRLTISGVYEERHEGGFTQKQFERTFDLPPNADVNAMASFITPEHMLVVEIPLGATASAQQVDHLNVDSSANNQRRLSFSLDKFNAGNNANSLLSSTSSDLSAPPNQSVRRTSITKTTTTTTTTGSSGLSPEAAELLRNADSKTSTTTTTSQSHPSTTPVKQTLLTPSDLANLPIDIPPELLASGGTITIQKRRVSVSKTSEAAPEQTTSTSTNNESKTSTNTTTTSHTGNVPINRGSNTNESKTTTTTTTSSTNQTGNVPINRDSSTNESKTTTTTTTTSNTSQSGNVPIHRNTDHGSLITSTNTTNITNQTGNVPISRTNNNNQSSSTSSHTSNSTTTSHDTPSRMYTLEEFLQNKTWNPSLTDGSNGKKILHMRLQMKPGVTADQMKISLNGYDLRVEVDNKVTNQDGRQTSEHSYRQVTLFPTCDVAQLKTELKNDGYLHIQVPITL